MYCRNCGKEITPEMEFCPVCGVRPASGKSFCPACGGQTNDLMMVCLRCGAKLDTVPAAVISGSAEKTPLPGVRSSYNWAWKMLWPNFGMLLLAFIIFIAISWIASYIAEWPFIGTLSSYMSSDYDPFLSSIPYGYDWLKWMSVTLVTVILTGLIEVFLLLPLEYGYAFTFVKAARREKLEAGTLFAGFKTYWRTVGAGVLTGLIICAGLVCLIVPGIFLACKLAFVPYLVIDKKQGPLQAIATSWKMTGGHAMAVFGIGLLAILLTIAGIICLGVGVIIAQMWIMLTLASLYYAVSAQQGAPAAPPAVLTH